MTDIERATAEYERQQVVAEEYARDLFREALPKICALAEATAAMRGAATRHTVAARPPKPWESYGESARRDFVERHLPEMRTWLDDVTRILSVGDDG